MSFETHDITSIKNADNIIVIKHGKVVGNDCHNKLVAKNKIFDELASNHFQQK
jgi:ABC-type multidrug transport system fused ATPase/permease subunit